METFKTREILCTKYVNISIKIQNRAFGRLFGSAPVQWSGTTNRLTRPCLSKLDYVPWALEQFIGDFLCGVIFPVWGLFFATNVQSINYFMFMMMLSSSIVQIGIAIRLWYSGEDIASGVNLLLDCQYHLVEGILQNTKYIYPNLK